jgi:hypothetical protein
MNNPKNFAGTSDQVSNTFFNREPYVYGIKFLTLYFINRLLKSYDNA